MGDYQVIARKWRPGKFSELVGQEHVARTMKNAIRMERIAHAYLLVGPRGVGKTTTARIFAKALNCLNNTDGEPCCECDICRSIAAEKCMDVIEIDAASRNSVESMRELAEEVRHMPVTARYKVYIIDEVHMLSKAAWNALLKTIEEPPAHVKFIFATTEAHQVLPTIVSRCQRFDLMPIATKLIFERLSLIAESEGVKISGGALAAIARAAQGGMRDAQSLLDQMIAFFSSGDNVIDEKEVLALFGLTRGDDLEKIARAMLSNDKAAMLRSTGECAKAGRNLEILLEDLLEFLRCVLLANIVADPSELTETDSGTLQRAARLAAESDQEKVEKLIDILSPAGRALRDAVNKLVYMEMLFLRAMREIHGVSAADILARLNQLRAAGEIDFVDKAPALAVKPLPTPIPAPVEAEAAPVQEEPAQIQETAPVEAEAAPVQETAPVEVKGGFNTAFSPVPADKTSKADTLFHLILGELEGRKLIDDDLLEVWKRVEVAGMEQGILLLNVTNPVERRDLGLHLEPLQTLIQELTGDWQAMVKLLPDLSELEETAEDVIPPEPVKEDNAELAVHDTEDMETAAVCQESDEDTTEENDTVPIPVPPADFEEADDMEEIEQEYSPVQSLMNDEQAVAEARDNTMVQQALDLFGGNIADIIE